MHQLITGKKLPDSFYQLISLVMIHFLMHLATYLSHCHHSQHPLLPHFSVEAQDLPFSQIFPAITDCSYLWTALQVDQTGLDLSTGLFSVYFLFMFCFGFAW